MGMNLCLGAVLIVSSLMLTICDNEQLDNPLLALPPHRSRSH